MSTTDIYIPFTLMQYLLPFVNPELWMVVGKLNSIQKIKQKQTNK